MLWQSALAQSCRPSFVFILHKPKSTSGVFCRLGDNSNISFTLSWKRNTFSSVRIPDLLTYFRTVERMIRARRCNYCTPSVQGTGMIILYPAVEEAKSQWFTLFWPLPKLSFNWSSLLRYKNITEIIINHKKTRMVKDGEDSHGLQTTNLKTLD